MHEWRQVSFSWGSWIECSCGFRPESQEQMDEHIPPKFSDTTGLDFVEYLGTIKAFVDKALQALDDEHEANFKHFIREIHNTTHLLRNKVEEM